MYKRIIQQLSFWSLARIWNHPKARLLQLGLLIATATPLLPLVQRGTVWPPTAEAAPQPVGEASPLNINVPICRYGVSSWHTADLPYLQQMRVGWVLDFGVNMHRTRPSGVEYTPVVRMVQDKDPVTGERLPSYRIFTQPLTDAPGGLGPIVTAHPGTLWLVGNEVDRVYWQDDLEPELYAEAYHEVYQFIKARDPSARIAISGLVQVTPGRLQYLDIMWNAYREKYGMPMPVDVWNMHLYILPERREYRPGDPPGLPFYDSRAAVAIGTDPELAIWESDGTSSQCDREDVYCYAEHDDLRIFAQQVEAMRRWMRENGEQNKPLILSEFSLLYPYIPEGDGCYLQDEFGNCFTPERVVTFMNRALDYLENAADPNLGYPLDNYRLVQQWLWYTMYDFYTPGTVNNMVTVNAEGEYVGLSLNGSTYRNRVIANVPYTNAVITGASSPTAVIPYGSSTVSVTLQATLRNNGNTTATDTFPVTFYADEARTQVIGMGMVTSPLRGCAMQETAVSITWPNLLPGAHRYWVAVGNSVGSGVVIINPQNAFLPVIRR